MFSLTLDQQRKFFASGATRSLDFRLSALKILEQLIIDNQTDISTALFSDLKKSVTESFTTEIAILLEEIRYTRKHLATWVKPETVSTPIFLKPGKSVIYREPLGAVLILSPWNYPLQLAVGPLIGAIAAGNCAIIKPSELAPHTAKLIRDLVAKAFAPEHVTVIEGGIEETTALLKEKFDHIFFTGSTSVGKIVMKAAAEHLTPVTLELGGKSPTIVTASADLDLAARRIAWGKFMNAGQTCVAPDYVYADESIIAKLLTKIQHHITLFYGEIPAHSPDYSRIINAKNFARLKKFVPKTADVFYGGDTDADTLYFEPTILKNVSWDDAVMKEEIFGPILPVLPFTNLNDVFEVIKSRPNPLSAYFFSETETEVDLFLEKISCGGACINDTLLHLSNPHLPFGGLGDSGMGSYHGKKSFDIFTHEKSVLHKSRFLDFSLRYPPYKNQYLKTLKRFFKA